MAVFLGSAERLIVKDRFPHLTDLGMSADGAPVEGPVPGGVQMTAPDPLRTSVADRSLSVLSGKGRANLVVS